MLIGILLIITWLVPVAAVVPEGLCRVRRRCCRSGPRGGTVSMARTVARSTGAGSMRMACAPERCPAIRPLQLKMNNGNDVPLTDRWRIAAYARTTRLGGPTTITAPRSRGLKVQQQQFEVPAIAATRPGCRTNPESFAQQYRVGFFPTDPLLHCSREECAVPVR
ncbi:hypothetical protein ACXX9E_29390 [Pseudomonas sp. GNP014]